MKTYFWKKIAVIIILVVAPLACFGESNIRVDDPWVREAPPIVKVLAAYMIIENPTDEQRILIGATASSSFQSVEIHKTVIKDGMMQMRHQPQLIIPQKSQVVLKPGSYHLMLMGSKKPLRAGDKVDLTLKFANGEEISIVAPVRKSN